MTNDDLRVVLRQLPAPEPRQELLERIWHSRATGARVVLPWDLPNARRWLVAAAAAAVLLGAWQLWPSRPVPAQPKTTGRDPFAELLGGSMLWPSPGGAQETHSAPPRPKYAVVLVDTLNPGRLVEGVWTYGSTTTTDDILTQPSGGRRIRLARTTYEGREAWMINTERGLVPYRGWGDTTYLDATSLRPLRASAHANRGRTRFEQTFHADSVRESIDMRGPIERSWRGAIALPFARNALFINDWSTSRLGAVLPALPVSRDWRGTVYQVAFISWDWARHVAPIDLRVVGTDRVTVPAGTFECWRIDVDMALWEQDHLRIWVSRDKGWLVKQQYRGSDYVVNEVLESYEPLQ